MPNTTSFVLVGTSGVKYNALEIRRRTNTSDLDGNSSIPGLSEFQLSDGRALNKKDENTFKLVDTGEELSRVQL